MIMIGFIIKILENDINFLPDDQHQHQTKTSGQ